MIIPPPPPPTLYCNPVRPPSTITQRPSRPPRFHHAPPLPAVDPPPHHDATPTTADPALCIASISHTTSLCPPLHPAHLRPCSSLTNLCSPTTGQSPITPDQGSAVAREIGAKYVECSAKVRFFPSPWVVKLQAHHWISLAFFNYLLDYYGA
jgi:hypothetical protein